MTAEQDQESIGLRQGRLDQLQMGEMKGLEPSDQDGHGGLLHGEPQNP